jgi:hypothetical protein
MAYFCIHYSRQWPTIWITAAINSGIGDWTECSQGGNYRISQSRRTTNSFTSEIYRYALLSFLTLMWGQANGEDLYFLGENPQSVTTMRHEPTTRYQGKKVKHNKSFIKLLLPGMVRWVITLLLMAGFCLAI